MIINRSGIIIRMAVADLRVMGRATQGVRLINIKEGDAIASVARVEVEEESEGIELENGIVESTQETNLNNTQGEDYDTEPTVI
jgi:DNA gyrase subunit A